MKSKFLNKKFFLQLFYFFVFYKEKIKLYIRDTRVEFSNISWASRDDVKQTVLVVMLIVFFTSLCLWIIDSILTYIISKFL